MFEHRRWIFNNRAYHFIFQQGILAHGIYPMGLLKVESRLFSDKAPFGSTYLSAFFCPTGSARARDGWLITPVGIFAVQRKQRKLWNTTDLGVFECSRNPAVANNHASIFFEPRRWWEVVDLNNFACLVLLHVPTIYSMPQQPLTLRPIQVGQNMRLFVFYLTR